MTNRLELNWRLDGFVGEQRYYCSEIPIDPLALPTPKNVLAGDMRTYTDTAIEVGKTYYVCIGSVKNGIEKISDTIKVIAGQPWNPTNAIPASYFDSDDLVGGDVNQWICRMTNVAVNASSVKPVLSTELGFKTCKFSAASMLSSTNVALTGLMSGKAKGSVFLVYKKDIIDTSAQSRRIFNITTASSTARFAIYADDKTSGNMNKLVVGGRRLDNDTYRYLSTVDVVDTSTHMMYADVDHEIAKFSLNTDGRTLLTAGTQHGVGITSQTNGSGFFLGGGATNAGYIGHLACSIFFDRVLSVSDRQKLEGWAAHKYGLIDNLPSDHPYKILVPVL